MMQQTWRLIDSGFAHPSYTAAVDEALFRELCVRAHDVPVLHLYVRNPPAVSVGYFCALREHVNIEYCAEHTVYILRRMTGGSAIYTDRNQLLYALILPETLVPGNLQDSYYQICSALIEGLKEFGLEPQFKPLNDVQVNGRKISGSAQHRSGRMILQHGTIIVDADYFVMDNVLTSVKLGQKGLKSNAERLISLRELLGYRPKIADVKRAVIKGFERVFNIRLKRSELNSEELKMIKMLMNIKYSNPAWNFRL